jgi:hypothetical protein
MDCQQCGALIEEGQQICPACGSQVRKPSFWRRLWKSLKFLPSIQITTKVTRTSEVEVKGLSFSIDKKTGKRYTLKDIPPELRDQLQNAIALGQTRVLLNEIPPELRAKLEEAMASGQMQPLSLDELPPELRAKLKNAIFVSGPGVAKRVISYRGPDGQVHTCQSLEEVPEDIRAKFKEAIDAGQGSAKEVFTYQGSDGQQHTYHSLEEMPEDIRAIFRMASKAHRSA